MSPGRIPAGWAAGHAVGETVPARGIHDAAQQAQECTATVHAVRLARWIREGGRPVTAGGALRRADVAAAGAVPGVQVPARVRTAADVAALHIPWCTAVAVGLLEVSDGQARGGPALGHWPPSDGELLDGWRAGLRAICAAGSDPRCRQSVSLLVLALLVVLDSGRRPAGGNPWPAADAALRELCELYDKPYWRAWDAAYQYSIPGRVDPVARRSLWPRRSGLSPPLHAGRRSPRSAGGRSRGCVTICPRR